MATPPPADAAPAEYKEALEIDYSKLFVPEIKLRYEFVGDEGNTKDRDAESEAYLYREIPYRNVGEMLYNLTDVKATIMSAHKPDGIASFDDAGLHPVVRSNIELSGYSRPMPIQAFVIPKVLEGMDMIAISQAGSGKTAAYAIPIINKFMGKLELLRAGRPRPPAKTMTAKPLAMIVVPTRELALQIFLEVCRLAYRSRLRPCAAFGGAPRAYNIDDIQKGCDILIGTPGRICDLVINFPEVVSLERLKYTVLDEADEMMSDDWEQEIHPLLRAGSNNADHQYLFFSATFHRRMRKIAREYLSDNYYSIKIGRIGAIHKNVHQQVYAISRDEKREQLVNALSQAKCRTMVFVSNNFAVEEIERFLCDLKFPVVGLSSLRTQMERENAVQDFSRNSAQILVCSSLAARGLDFIEVKHVINYDLPSAKHGGIIEYIHRIGRTARIGHPGQATSFFDKERDAELGPALWAVLKEANHPMPEFLDVYAQPGAANGLVNLDGEGSEDSEDGEDAAVGTDDGW